MFRRGLVATVLGILALSGVVAAVRWLRPSEPPRGEAYNVILISIDTLRADHLACYGHPSIATPHIDRLAAEGTLFEQCTAAVPLTLPSHATMFTGADPYVHGARDNGHFYLHEDNETLPEALRSAGYVTLAEVAAYVLNGEYGIAQGFDVYNDVAVQDGLIGLAERRGDVICDGALELLRRHRDERFFLFAHFYDPHFPYEPRPPFAQQYDDPYVAEIAFVDHQVGRLMDGLRELGLDENTLVVLVADHGESRGEHGEETHGVHVYDATMSVPMIWWRPGKIPAGRRLDMQVRLTDLAPTILDFLALQPLKRAQGASLLPQINGTPDPERTAYSESMMPYHNWGYAAPRALRRSAWKYIHAARPQLYDVAKDPGELNNLAQSETRRVAVMRAALEQLIDEAPAVAAPGQAQRQVTSAELERLRALGYAGGEEPRAEADAGSEKELLDLIHTHPDAHEHADEIDRMQAALRQVVLRNYPAAECDLREIIALRGPAAEIPWVYANLGLALARQRRHEEALPHYRRALELDPKNGTTLTNFGLSLIELARFEDAAAIFAQAVQIKPTLPMTHEGYGLALYRAGRLDEAAEQFREAVRIAPQSPQTHARLARMLLESGRASDALDVLEGAVAANPDATELLELIADALLRSGRHDDAVEALQQVVARAPDRASAWRILALSHVRKQRWSEAAECFHRAVAADPENSQYANDLAWLLATCPDSVVRDGRRAVRLAERARELRTEADANVLDTLAAALAEEGRFAEAVAAIDEAIGLVEADDNAKPAAGLRQRRLMYERREPYRLTP